MGPIFPIWKIIGRTIPKNNPSLIPKKVKFLPNKEKGFGKRRE